MNKKAVLVIDPGKISGVALFWFDEDLAVATNEMTVADTVEGFEIAARNYEDLTVVVENYVISQRTVQVAPQCDALDLIGYTKLRAQTLEIPYVLQTPAQAKSFATDDKLKALGWYERTTDGHRNDACRHLLVYLVQHEKAYSAEHIIPRIAKEVLK